MYFLLIIVSSFALERKVQKNTRKLIEGYADRLENSAVSGYYDQSHIALVLSVPIFSNIQILYNFTCAFL